MIAHKNAPAYRVLHCIAWIGGYKTMEINNSHRKEQTKPNTDCYAFLTSLSVAFARGVE